MDETKPKERPSHCTCGTKLVEDALFCHRCGRPVFEITVRAEEAHEGEHDASVPAAAPPPPSILQRVEALRETGYQGPPEPIDLRNKLAVQIAFFVAVVEFPLVWLSQVFPLNPMLMWAFVVCLGGFSCVFLYQNRTNSRLGALNGFRLGWISGLLLFLLVLAFGALLFAILSFSGGSMMEAFEASLNNSGSRQLSPEEVRVVRELFTDWTRLFIVILAALFLLFLLFTACAGIGGVLAARTRPSQSRS